MSIRFFFSTPSHTYMKHKYRCSILVVIIILFSVLQNCYSQDTVGLHYEFRIFKDGKALTDKTKRTRVEAGVYNLEKKHYEKLFDNCFESDKYCFDYCYVPNSFGVQFFLKIFAGKDSMIILSEISLDSIIFKPGQYYYSNFNKNRFNIFPANNRVTIEQVNPMWSIAFNNCEQPNLRDTRNKYCIYWYDTNKSVTLDTSFKWVNYWGGLLTVNPRDTSIFIKAINGTLEVSRDHGKNWIGFHPYFKDVIVDICITNDNSEYLLIMREGKYFKAEPEAYLKSGQVIDTIKIIKREEIQCKDSSLLENIKFKKEFIQDNEDFEFIEDDSGIVIEKYKGENLFLLKRHANYASKKHCGNDVYNEYNNSHIEASNYFRFPGIFYLGSQILIEFDDCFLYSHNGKNWYYYSLTDFTFFTENPDRYIWKEKNIAAVYFLNDKSILIDINYCGMFLINLHH
jgi:hypothetical protein